MPKCAINPKKIEKKNFYLNHKRFFTKRNSNEQTMSTTACLKKEHSNAHNCYTHREKELQNQAPFLYALHSLMHRGGDNLLNAHSYSIRYSQVLVNIHDLFVWKLWVNTVTTVEHLVVVCISLWMIRIFDLRMLLS